MRGKGPTARRLRCLAATLPLGEPRLEPIRLAVDRRPASVNLRCLRVRASGGESGFGDGSGPSRAASSTPSRPRPRPSARCRGSLRRSRARI